MRAKVNWTRVAVVVLIVAAVGALAAWRLMPRAPVPATKQMIVATGSVRDRITDAMGPRPSAPSKPETDRDRLLAAAFSMLDIPYRWGAKGPDELDCSGFSKAAYEAVGVSLPNGSFNQAEGELPIESLNDLAPGDLLFYRWQPTAGVTHVTLYAGDGWAIGTGSPGQPNKVVVYPLADDLKMKSTVLTYRHIELRDER